MPNIWSALEKNAYITFFYYILFVILIIIEENRFIKQIKSRRSM